MEFLIIWQHTFSGRASERAGESTSKRKRMVFCNLITEDTALHFCHICFFRSKFLGSALTQRGRLNRAMDTNRWGLLGALSEAAYHKVL